MKKIVSLIAGCLFAAVASADTASPKPFTAYQPDGTALTLRMVGDEHFHYFVDTTNGRSMLRNEDGSYYYAGNAEMQQLRTTAKLRREAANERRIARLTARQAVGLNTVIAPNSQHKAVGEFNGALTGTRKGLVILVNYAGTKENIPYKMQTTRDDWDKAFNQRGYNKNDAVGSVHDYFYDQSYGKLNLDFDVVGPYTVSHELEWYGQNGSAGDDRRAAYMIKEACELANPDVNFKDYDWDGDGEVDQVYVIYAGYGEATEGSNPNTIWPHEFHLIYTMANTYKPLKLDGVDIDTYACSNELCGTSGTKMNGIGTACHEFSHCIGFPDFYDTDYSGGWGMDTFDVMCSGGHNGPNYDCEVPCGYTAYERWMAGWLTPKELREGCYIENLKDISEEPDAYIIYNNGNRDEYFLLENRQGKRWFSFNQVHPSYHGMIITHVDYNKKAWTTNTPNTDPDHQRMTIVPAGGNYGTYFPAQQAWGITKAVYQSMYFPGTKYVRAFTNDSHYDKGGKLWNANTDGTFYLNKSITDITEDLEHGTIAFTFSTNSDTDHHYMVKLDAGEGRVSTASLTQSKNCEYLVLPSAESGVEGVCFAGWSTKAIASTSARPTGLMPAGTAYMPLKDITLYAVYAFSDEEALVDTYKPATSLKRGHKYVFTNSNNASAANLSCLSAEGLNTNDFIKSYASTPISFAEGTTNIVNPNEACTWIVKSNDGQIVLYNGQNYLALNSTEGIMLSDETTYLGWDEKYGLYAVKAGSSTKYYLRIQSGTFSFNRTGSETTRLFAFELDDLSTRNVTFTSSPITGIGTITLPTTTDNTVYDLQGRRVNTTNHGVTIVGGKKVVR